MSDAAGAPFLEISSVQGIGASAAMNINQQHAWLHGVVEGLALAGLESLVLGADGKALTQSPGLQDLLGVDVELSGGLLACYDLEGQNRLTQAIRIAKGGAAAACDSAVVLRRHGGHSPLLVQISSLRVPGRETPATSQILLMFRDLDSEVAVQIQDLRELFPLSPAEADIAVLMAKGMSVADVALMRGVTRETVRGQLKSVFRKLDTNRQSDLVRLVDRLGRTKKTRG